MDSQILENKRSKHLNKEGHPALNSKKRNYQKEEDSSSEEDEGIKALIIDRINTYRKLLGDSIRVPLTEERFREIAPNLENYSTYRIPDDPNIVIMNLSIASEELERMNETQLRNVENLVKILFPR